MFDKSLIEVSLEIEKEFVEPVSYLFKKHCDYDYIIEEKYARDNKLGIWKSEFLKPYVYRRQNKN